MHVRRETANSKLSALVTPCSQLILTSLGLYASATDQGQAWEDGSACTREGRIQGLTISVGSPEANGGLWPGVDDQSTRPEREQLRRRGFPAGDSGVVVITLLTT